MKELKCIKKIDKKIYQINLNKFFDLINNQKQSVSTTDIEFKKKKYKLM